MVSHFPVKKRLSFLDCHKSMQKFPFHAFASNHHSTYPDIAVSLPGKKIPDNPTWRDFSTIIEVKPSTDEDPFDENASSLKRSRSLVQLAVNARNLMHAHGSLAVFVIGIYGDTLRIARFDHAAAVVSNTLDIHDDNDVEVLHQFFWQLVHPCSGDTIVGCDPTVHRLTTADEDWLIKRLRRINRPLDPTLLSEARRAELFDDGDHVTAVKPYFLFQALDVNGRLFSRATTVWLAIPDTRVFVNGKLSSDPEPREEDLKVRVVKEAWRQLARRPESDFYERLELIPEDKRIGLAKRICGGDVGEREVQEWEKALYGKHTVRESNHTLEKLRHRNRLDAPKSTSSSNASSASVPPSLSTSTSALNAPVHRPMHQTFTWRQVYSDGDRHWHRERSQMRFVVDIVGRPLTHFRTTKEMVMALRDAIRGNVHAHISLDALFLMFRVLLSRASPRYEPSRGSPSRR